MKNGFSKTVILCLVGSLVVGQLLRLPLPGQGGGLLISDIATVMVIIVASLKKTFSWYSLQQAASSKPQGKKSPLLLTAYYLLLFILWSAFTLVLRFTDLGPHDFSLAALYWLRLSSTLLLLPALIFLLREPSIYKTVSRALLVATAALVGLGLAQIVFFPDLHLAGFDPHRGRLFSTWLDPNLFGGSLIITIPWLMGVTFLPLTKGESRARRGVGVLLLTALLALFLTQSRSSFIALVGAGILLFPFLLVQLSRFSSPARSGLALTLGISSLIVILAVAVFLPQRLAGIFTIDETAELRLASLSSAWQLAEQHPWLGVGYNAYQFAARDEGLIQDFSLHSRAGSDSSPLTLAVTTGLPGVILFFLPWALVLSGAVRRAATGDILALGAVVSLVALFLHSQFLNSFLYSHLLITLILITALCLSSKNSSSASRPSFPVT